MMLLTVAALILFASLSVAVGISNRHAGPAVRGRARLGIVLRLPREAQCAICPEDIETDDGTATLAFDQGSTYGITTCTYEESSGTEIICPYVTDTGELNGTVEYCPQTIALGDCENNIGSRQGVVAWALVVAVAAAGWPFMPLL